MEHLQRNTTGWILYGEDTIFLCQFGLIQNLAFQVCFYLAIKELLCFDYYFLHQFLLLDNIKINALLMVAFASIVC